jgi:hypothetical protein
MKPLRIAPTVAILLAAAACSSDRGTAESGSDVRTDSAGGLVISSGIPYRETQSDAAAALVVTVPGDSSSGASAPRCGDGSSATGGTVFWVEGIHEGKPLPNERRYQLLSGNCGLEPRLQATVIGGAINVINDVGIHRLVFLRAGTTDTLQVMPFSLDGSIVATERLTKAAGVVEVRCAKHPAEKAYIAVFDHPYFGIAATGDKITVDSVPPGDYKVMTWREGMAAPAAVPTKVGPAGQTEVVLR